MNKSKECECCGIQIYKKTKDSARQWESKRFCSQRCNVRSRSYRPEHIRFWDRVKKSDGCWEWSGSKDNKGYGILSSYKGGASIKAHRLSYEMANGEIPSGMVIRHKCDNPTCVNPSHLEIGTQKDNVRDMVARGRMNKKSLENLDHSRALSKEQVKEIESLKFVAANGRGQGVMVKDIAKKYGVSINLITQIKSGKYVNSTKRAV